jgi:hypothetical protein
MPPNSRCHYSPHPNKRSRRYADYHDISDADGMTREDWKDVLKGPLNRETRSEKGYTYTTHTPLHTFNVHIANLNTCMCAKIYRNNPTYDYMINTTLTSKHITHNTTYVHATNNTHNKYTNVVGVRL